jgi:alpha-tubulin suppressor-like RCC1 family protein
LGFGYNEHGQLGLCDNEDRKTPNLKAKYISTGLGHTVTIDLDDDIWGFGHNVYGQLELADHKDRNEPIQISNLKAKHVSAGISHTIMIV